MSTGPESPPQAQGQTAIGGLFSVFSINTLTRVVSYFRHILIATLIGLSGGLDVFFTALSVVGIVVLIFGDIFDSVGVPRLVRSRMGDDGTDFREVAQDVVKVSVLLSAGCTLALLAVSPYAHLIVPGFSASQKGELAGYILYLVPMALVYLPYHSMGSVLRSLRHFRAFYLAELVSASVTVALLLAWHTGVDSVAIAWSSGYLVGTIYLAIRVRRHLSHDWFGWDGGRVRTILSEVFKLLPTYLVAQLYTLSDRVFGSFLPEGSISALYYALFVATAIPSLLAVENVFSTPMAESGDRSSLLTRIVCGVFLAYVPITLFTVFHSREIVSILFEHGAFRSASVDTTAAALSCYVLALPAWGIWGIVVRYHQVLGRLGTLLRVSVIGLVSNVALSYVFCFPLGMGVKGLALGPACTAILVVLIGYRNLKGLGISIRLPKVAPVFLQAALFSAVSLAAVRFLPLERGRIAGFLATGAVYVALYAAALQLSPGAALREIRDEIWWNIDNLLGRKK
jgi:putative peptidoglycan lipid II flippase